jgi:hypothetical protein
MKKMICGLLALMLLLPIIPHLGNAAAKGKISLSSKTEKFQRGLAFEVDVELNRNPGISSLRATLEFDEKVLEILKVENLSLLPGFASDQKKNELMLRWKKSGEASELTATGRLCRITFRVKEDAIYGDSKISLAVSQKLYDAVNSSGKSIAFDAQGLSVPLICPHKNTKNEVITEASFEQAGLLKKICTDCGENFESALLPTLSSKDTKLSATLPTGIYQEKDEKELRYEYLYGGKEVDEAGRIFSELLLRTFRIRFLKNGAEFVPEEKIPLMLEIDFELPEDFSLYLILDGGMEEIEVKRNKNALSFDYQDGAYALVIRERVSNDPPPSTTAPEKTEVPKTTLSEEEKRKQKDLLVILGGVAVFLVCGAGIVVLTKKRRHF